MTTFSSDMNGENRRTPKYRSKLQVSREMLHSYFGIPDELEITNVQYDFNREIVTIFLRGEEGQEGVYECGEGMEVVAYDPTEWMKRATRRRYQWMVDAEAESNDNQGYRMVLREEDSDA